MLRILIITERDSPRAAAAAARFDGLKADWQVSPAIFVTGSQPWSPHYDDKRRMRITGYPMTRGEVGCFLAHREAWRRVAEGADERVLILEDDAVISASDLPAITAIAESEGSGAAVVLLFSITHLNFRRWRQVGNVSLVKPNHTTYSAVAYMISQQTAKRLLAASESFFFTVDEFFNMEYLHGLPLLHTYPFLAKHPKDVTSVIGSRAKPRISNARRLLRNFHILVRRFRDGVCRLRTRFRMGLLFTPTERPERV